MNKSGFDPIQYWENRHTKLKGSPRSVSDIRLSPEQNRELIIAKAVIVAHTLGKIGLTRRARILDAGCGAGVFTDILRKAGFNIKGIDCSPAAIREAKKTSGAGYTVGLLSELHSDVPYDVILCLDVLFHIVNDSEWKQSLNKLLANLNKGGSLLIIEYFPGESAEVSPHCKWRSWPIYRDYFERVPAISFRRFTFKYPYAPESKTMIIVTKQRNLKYRLLEFLSKHRWAKSLRPLLNRLLGGKKRQRSRSDRRRKQVSKKKLPQAADVMKLAQAMRAGFGRSGANRLEPIKREGRPKEAALAAAWNLARWYSVLSNHERTLDNLTIRRLAGGPLNKRHVALEVEALVRLNRVQEADKVLQEAFTRLGEIPELCFCAANAALLGHGSQLDVSQLQLHWINKPWMATGLASLRLKDASRPLDLTNVTVASVEQHPRSSHAKVSVLMPAHNAESTIATAIESVLSQTWTNLELIAVDDGSHDNTWSIIQSLAASDSRMIALRHDKNNGAYSARNTALRAATGDLITVQDADDWSHPARLALQAITTLDSGRLLSITMLLRVEPRLRIQVTPDGDVIRPNLSSLMARRHEVLELGGWDECRMGADDELLARLSAKYGAVKTYIFTEVPLSLATTSSRCLTAQPDIGRHTIQYGARREYVEAYSFWHRLEQSKATPDLRMHGDERPFPIPHICRNEPPRTQKYDILLVSDLSFPGGTTSSNIHMLRAAKALGLSCAVFHWPRLSSAGTNINTKIRRLIHEGIADSVVVGETVDTKLVIVTHPAVLNDLPDMRLEVRTQNCVVVINQAPRARFRNGRTVYEIDIILEHAQLAFGMAPILAPISPLIRRVLKDATDYENFTPIDWTPLTDWIRPAHKAFPWDSSRLPVVGRHGRDHEDKWPSDPTALRAAYCAEQPVPVHILGGAGNVKLVLGEIPSNWTVMPFDSVDVATFLSGLDFFVHYPHEDCIEAFGYAALEAMAMGVPAILPPSFRETFEDAAVYANPNDVLDVIRSLWKDRDDYQAQVERGFAYIDRACSYARFEDQLGPYLLPSSVPTKSPCPSVRDAGALIDLPDDTPIAGGAVKRTHL